MEKEKEVTEEIRDILEYITKKTPKKKEWSIVYYELAFEILLSELYAVRNVLNVLDKSARTIDDTIKALDTIRDILYEQF